MAEYYFIEKFQDVEATLIPALTTYFHDKVKVQEVFPKFGVLRIDETHPAAILNMAVVNGQPVPGNLFPSITVSAVEDSIGAQMLNLERSIVEVDEEWATEQLTNPLVLKSQAQALKDFIVAQGRSVFGLATADRIQERVLCAAWAENREVRNFIYAHLRAFFAAHGRKLQDDMGLQNGVLAGTPSGLYNMDFGKILYGSELSLTADRNITHVYLNTDWEKVADVQFSMAEIGQS